MVQGQRRIAVLGRVILGTGFLALTACSNGGTFDPDLRKFGQGGFSTSDAALQATAPRPAADARGVISYPGYQVAVARQGDTVESVAARVGIPASELASYNAVPGGSVLRKDEILALPRRVAEGAPAIGTLPTQTGGVPTGGGIDVTTIASGALDRVDATGAGTAVRPLPATVQPLAPVGAEPVRHQVVRGETAYSIARLYNVNVRALADWNGLGTDLAVREGQYLLIPVANQAAPVQVAAVTTAPGEGSPTPLPPSAKDPLPKENPPPASAKVKTPATPDLSKQQTAASDTAKLAFPADGKIVKGYKKGKNDGIDIGAAAGAPVRAAASGTVAAITKDTDQVPILVLRHDGNLLTVYANIDGIAVAKGAKVARGQTIAKVRAGASPFLHFEVRQGFDSVDPMPFLK